MVHSDINASIASISPAGSAGAVVIGGTEGGSGSASGANGAVSLGGAVVFAITWGPISTANREHAADTKAVNNTAHSVMGCVVLKRRR